MKMRPGLLFSCLIGAAAVAVFGDKTPADSVVPAVTRAGPVRSDVGTISRPVGVNPPIDRLMPRMNPGEAELVVMGGESHSPFQIRSWTRPPLPVVPAPVAVATPPAAVVPTLPFTFLGKALNADGWEVFLARGDGVLIVNASSVIDGVYRVDAIAPPVLTFTYLPMNQVQQLNIGAFD
jgi:hypothetical protein